MLVDQICFMFAQHIVCALETFSLYAHECRYLLKGGAFVFLDSLLIKLLAWKANFNLLFLNN